VRRTLACTTATLLLASMLLVLVQAQGTPPPAPLTLISREGRRAVPTVIISGQEFIALDDVASLFQVTVAEDAPTGGVTVTYRGRTIVLSAQQSIASVNGRVTALPAPVTRSGRRILVPLEFLSRALGPIYDRRIDLRRPARLLIVGDVTVPRVVARIDSAGPPTRATIEVTPSAPVTVTADVGRILVRVEADALDLALPAGANGLIEQIRAGDQPNLVVLLLGGAAGTPRTATATADGATRITIEVPGAAAPAGDTTAAPPPPSPVSDPAAITARRRFSLVVLDPGHGGDDAGVRASDGLLEKEVTLDVARRLKQRLETRLGVRVILTRDDDRTLGPDERAAFANNSKADLFLSLHANGALGPGMAGAEVYSLSLDQEGENVRRITSKEAVTLPAIGGTRRTLEIVPWNLAQAAHVDRSTTLAAMLGEELARRLPMSPRGVQRAGMRVLTGANMPAALVELAYLTNPDQAAKARGEEFRNAAADALFESVSRFRTHVDDKSPP
jgi:N-acetylmuramoyl-L-alanine amidase